MPTKTEQADLLQAMFGRNGEAPVPIVAPRSPADCFDAAIEAARIATTYRTPVFLLSDGYLANGSEPWRIPDVDDLPDLRGRVRHRAQPADDDGRAGLLALPARPGDAGPAVGGPGHAGPRAPDRRHREGRRHRQHLLRPGQPRPHGAHRARPRSTGSPRPSRRSRSTTRPATPGAGARLGLDVRPDRRRRAGWCAPTACEVAQAHLRHLNPFPADLGDVLRRYDRVLVPEMNLGQLGGQLLLRAQVPGRRDRLQPGARAAVQGRGARRRSITRRCIDDIGSRVTIGSTAVPLAATWCRRRGEPQTAKDFKTDQEVRWCPGCGDYAILAAVQSFMPELGLARENIVFVSGIGCSSRFPYYMDTYGMHSIHGRAPAIATGLAASRPDLSVWVVTGDGDALSIGGNHLIHALRRNVNLKILLFNNRIYGLTKGQYSPTSELGQDHQVDADRARWTRRSTRCRWRSAPRRTFVARTIDSDRKHLTSVLRAAADHRGTALVEIYQNCNIFNDDAFEPLKDPATRDDFTIRLEHGAADPVGRRPRARRRALATTRRSRWSRSPTSTRPTIVRARRARRGPVVRVRPVPAGRRRRSPAPRSASSATSTGRSTTT